MYLTYRGSVDAGTQTSDLGWDFFPSMTGFNLFNRSFSNNFDIIGSKDIGLYDDVSWGGLPDFGIMTTSATFHSWGTYFKQNDVLISLVSFTRDFLGSSFSICLVMRSKPGDIFGLMFILISLLTSAGEVSGILTLSCQMTSGSTSVVSVVFGWKMFSKCSANLNGFCSLILAELPSMFLIGGISIIGLLTFLVVFQSEYSVIESLVNSLRNSLIVSFFSCLISSFICEVKLFSLFLSCSTLVWCHFILDFLFSKLIPRFL